MKLYYSPNACSLGIHFLLEEIGKPYELEKVSLAEGAQHKPPYVTLNPKAKVPLLQRDDGSLLTEFPAIVFYLAKSNPAARLLPEDLEGEVRALELLDYMIATIHMRGFTRVFRPGAFAPSEADHPAVKQAGLDIVTQGFKILEPVLADKEFILGTFSGVEAALFYLEFWARNRAKLALPAKFEAHLDRLLARETAQRVLASEGLSASGA